MKVRIHNETYFSAKMVLLFALVSLAMPDRRKGLELVIRSLFRTDSSGIGPTHPIRVAGQAHFQSSFNH